MRLAEAGFAIHWLYPKSKRPIGEEWSTKAVASPDLLKASYRRGNNVGVRLGKWSKIEGLYLHIIDMDVRESDMAEVALKRLHDLLPELDTETFPTVISGSGGASRHFYLLSDKPFTPKKFAHSTTFKMVWDEKLKRDVKKWDWELHLLGTGAQAAIPPSIHPDTEKPYQWLREFDFNEIFLGVAPLVPSEALERITGREDESEIDPDAVKPLGLSLEEARDILTDIPAEQYREDRDGWLNVGMALHHEFGGDKKAFDLWCEYSSASRKFDKADQWRVWKSFKPKPKMLRMATLLNAAKEERLMRAIDDEMDEDLDDLASHKADELDEFDDLPDLEDGKVSKRQEKINKAKTESELEYIPKRIRRFNEKHAVARVKGATVILDFHSNGDVSYGSPAHLHNYYENDRIATDKATEPYSKHWMRHKGRREYPAGIVFAPNQEVVGAYNHWQGFSVEPDPKASCRLLLKHLRMVVCRDDTTNYEYLLGWLAHMIQRPQETPGVAGVLRGRKGTGKDTVGDYVGGLFPHHHVKIANQEQLTGKFNAHQEKCLLLHVEEGFWAGSKNAEGALKHLITSESVLIEPKGINQFKVTSVLRLLITSNERWVVPATEEERRYFVLDVGEQHMQDTDYFQAIRKEMLNGGREALLHYLQTYSLENFNVRKVPSTDALTEQKLEGLKNIEKWWFSALDAGHLELRGKDGFDAESDLSEWEDKHVRVDRDEFRAAYTRWMRTRRHDGEELSEAHVGRRLRVMLPLMEERRLRRGQIRNRVYVLPPIDVCREQFEDFIGGKIEWSTRLKMTTDDLEEEEDDLI